MDLDEDAASTKRRRLHQDVDAQDQDPLELEVGTTTGTTGAHDDIQGLRPKQTRTKKKKIRNNNGESHDARRARLTGGLDTDF